MKQWIIGIFAASLLTAVASAVLPKGGARKITSFVGGLLIILAAMGPIAKLTADDLSKQISKYKIKAEEIRTGIDIGNSDIMALIIQEQTEAYILDKAGQLGLELQVEVQTETASDGWPYPSSVTIRGAAGEYDKQRLTEIIREDLAIGPERQEWS